RLVIRLTLSFLHILFFFFFNHPATTEIYTLSLHDALPIFAWGSTNKASVERCRTAAMFEGFERHDVETEGATIASFVGGSGPPLDRKSTRLNSSHVKISYAVFCLKKKKRDEVRRPPPKEQT